MYPSDSARQVSILLRTSRELDIVGDVTSTTSNPSELLAWAYILPNPTICAWRGQSGKPFVQVAADYTHDPVRGRVTAVLACGEHPQFWHELIAGPDLPLCEKRQLTLQALSAAWDAMPLTLDS